LFIFQFLTHQILGIDTKISKILGIDN
jgi:hypothetical protein